MDLTPFALFVSPVEGHLVSRYGTARPDHGPYVIGGTLEQLEVDPSKPVGLTDRGAGRWTVDPSRIEALTRDEVTRFGREYQRAIGAGALRERTAEEFAAQLEVDAAAAKAARQPEPSAPAASGASTEPASKAKRSKKEQ